MDNRWTRMLAVAALAAVIGQPANAAMGCWTANEASALRLKDMQSRLMVATLRCNAMGFKNSAAYNEFILANRAALGEANRSVKARFTAAFGKSWQREYDRFNTSLANAYGAAPTDAAICAETARLAREAKAAGGRTDRLLLIADRLGAAPVPPGGRCSSANYAAL